MKIARGYRTWRRLTTVVIALMAALGLGAGNALAEPVAGWYAYSPQSSWHCQSPSGQFNGDLYFQLCVSYNPSAGVFQALVHINTTAEPTTYRTITAQIYDGDSNSGVYYSYNYNGTTDQSRTCGTGGYTAPGNWVCFAHTVPLPATKASALQAFVELHWANGTVGGGNLWQGFNFYY